jgi:hypothetical protein
MLAIEPLASYLQSRYPVRGKGNAYQPVEGRVLRRDDHPAPRTNLRADAAAVGCIADVLVLALRIFLLPGFRTISRYLRRLHWERRALDWNSNCKWGLLEPIYDATLDRLGNARNASGWWGTVVLVAEGGCILPHSGSEPHFLAIPSVREWLSNEYVRTDLKVLASEMILGVALDTVAARRRLSDWYAHYTAEDSARAASRIDAAVSGLVAGVLSSLNVSEQLLVDVMRQSNVARKEAQITTFCYKCESNRSAANKNSHDAGEGHGPLKRTAWKSDLLVGPPCDEGPICGV